MRRIVIVAGLAGGVALLRVWLGDAAHETAPENSPSNVSVDLSRDVSTSQLAATSPLTANDSRKSVPATSTEKASSAENDAPVRLEVRAPSDVRVGDVFQVRVEINANAAVHELLFLVGYPALRLKLVGWSRGNFTEQRDLPADFGAEEPSDGNIQITYSAKGGSSVAGAGSFVVLEFEAIAPGTATITLQNVAASGVNGTMESKTFALQDAQVTIR